MFGLFPELECCEINTILFLWHFWKCLGNCRKTHCGPGGGQGGEPPVRACEKLAPVMGGIEVR